MDRDVRVLRAALIALTLTFTILPLPAALPLFDPDEGLHAAIAQEMGTRGDYVTPTFVGEPFLDKPILFFWSEAWSIRGLRARGLRRGPFRRGAPARRRVRRAARDRRGRGVPLVRGDGARASGVPALLLHRSTSARLPDRVTAARRRAMVVLRARHRRRRRAVDGVRVERRSRKCAPARARGVLDLVRSRVRIPDAEPIEARDLRAAALSGA